MAKQWLYAVNLVLPAWLFGCHLLAIFFDGVFACLDSYCCGCAVHWQDLESIRFEHNNMLQTHTSQSIVREEKTAEATIQNGCKTEIVLGVEVMVGAHRPIAASSFAKRPKYH